MRRETSVKFTPSYSPLSSLSLSLSLSLPLCCCSYFDIGRRVKGGYKEGKVGENVLLRSFERKLEQEERAVVAV